MHVTQKTAYFRVDFRAYLHGCAAISARTGNGDKTISSMNSMHLLLFWLLLDNNLAFSGAVCCFLRRHLPRLSSFQGLSTEDVKPCLGYLDTCQTCLRHKMRWQSLYWLLAKLSTTFWIGGSKYQVFLGPPSSPEPLFSSFWLNSNSWFCSFWQTHISETKYANHL